MPSHVWPASFLVLVTFARLMNAEIVAERTCRDQLSPHFDMVLSEANLADDARGILLGILSCASDAVHTSTGIELQPLTIATQNKAFKVLFNGETFLLRIFGRKSELLVNRKRELVVLRMAKLHLFGPELLATFQNGYVTEFLPGAALEPEDLLQPFYAQRIAATFRKWHSLTLDSTLQRQLKATSWDTIDEWVGIAMSQLGFGENAEFMQVVEEVEMLKRRLAEYGTERHLVFSHNDLNHGNILYHRERDHMVFVDYEYTGLNYRGFDLGNHFCEYAGLDLDWSRYPTEAQQLLFLRAYLGDAATEEELRSLAIEANKWSLVSHLLWYIWASMQSKISDITHFSYTRYASLRLQEYYRKKELFLSL